jgi:hypothetical protein
MSTCRHRSTAAPVQSFCSIGTILPSRPARATRRRAQRRSRMARLRATAPAARSVLDGREHDGILDRVGAVICPSNNQTIKRRSQKAMKKRADAYFDPPGAGRSSRLMPEFSWMARASADLLPSLHLLFSGAPPLHDPGTGRRQAKCRNFRRAHRPLGLLAIRNPACPPEERGSSMLSRLPLCSRRILLRARASRPKYVDMSRTLTTA